MFPDVLVYLAKIVQAEVGVFQYSYVIGTVIDFGSLFSPAH